MKKLILTLFSVIVLAACGPVYNTQLKQIELGMTEAQVVSLMGDKYTVTQSSGKGNETIVYKDKFKNYWYFVFVDGSLNKWYKESE